METLAAAQQRKPIVAMQVDGWETNDHQQLEKQFKEEFTRRYYDDTAKEQHHMVTESRKDEKKEDQC